MTNRPLVVITLCFAAGIALGLYLPFPVITSLLVLFFILSFLQVLRGKQFTIPLLLLFLTAGALSCHLSLGAARGNIRDFSEERGTLLGTVAGEPLWQEDEVIFPLQPEEFQARGEKHAARGQARVVLRLQEDEKRPVLFYGQQVSLQGILYEPAGQRNPGGFDYRFFLERQGIAATFYTTAEEIEDLGLSAEVSRWQRFVYSTRQKVQELIGNSLPPGESALLRGIFLGERSAVDAELALAFQRSGAAHLMAVSGLHIGMLAALLWALWRRLSFKGWPSYLLLLSIVFLYAALTGMRPATLRALIMLAAALGALQWNRRSDLPAALAFAALITLIGRPLLLFDVGFQLSYTATMAIIAFAGPISRRLTFLPPYLQDLAAVSLAAQLGVLPLSAYYFNQFPLVALAANLLLLPVMPFIVGLSFLGAVAGFFWPLLGSLFYTGTYPLLLYMGFGVRMLSSLPGAYWEMQGIREGHLLLAYGLPVTLYILHSYLIEGLSIEKLTLKSSNYYWKKIAVSVFLIVFFAVSWFYPARADDGYLEVVFFDVGQGDAVFIETPDGYTALIDGGGRLPFRGNMEWTGERVILPYLRWRGIKKLDVVMISHPHEDHFGGLFPVFREKEVGMVLISPDQGSSANYQELLNLLESLNISREMAGEGDVLRLGTEVFFSFYAPGESLFQGTSSDANNNSLVKKMTYDQISFLFTGDIEEDAVVSLLQSGYDLQSDVLKVPHHGGYFASIDNFLMAVAPQVGVICVGTNTFGHPHSTIMESLYRHGVEVYRTDNHGAVTIKTDGRAIQLEPFLQEDDTA